ncbi:MAG TPA: aminoacetone oxidase family FAD-binding enzyme, partial [Bacteroidales bacterium]|nr:aminoacetone oxidase family FAD-binding enzyme [Bacteroidales bacterium]
MKRRVIIVGAGAAGMLAAIAAAQQGAEVTLLEKMDRPGRKIAITGKGRCNITNSSSISQFLEKTGPDARFLKNAFARFFSKEIIELLQEEGVAVVEERGGRFFPESQKAADVNRALTNRLTRLGVKTLTNCRVDALTIEAGIVVGVKLTNGRLIPADRVIMATGGVSYPGTGSTGDGYKILSEVGHKIIKPKPSLVPMLTKGDLAGRLQGLALKNVTAALWKNGKKIGEEFGELLFTHFGLSGPIILTLSRRFSTYLDQPEDLYLTIDLKPALDHQKLDLRLLRELEEHGKMLMHNILHSLLPSSMVDVCLQETEIDGSIAGHQLKAEQRKRLT